MQAEIILDDDIDVKEFGKSMSFVSKNILSYKISNDKLLLELTDECDLDMIVAKIKGMEKQFRRYKYDTVVTEINSKKGGRYYPDILNNDELFGILQKGLLYLKGKSIFLFSFFEECFSKLANDMNAIHKLYPVLLPVDDYLKTGYINRSPQHAIFCGSAHENIDELEQLASALQENKVLPLLDTPRFALSPSACFHVYIDYRGKVLPNMQTVSFTQNVFRNEGRFNYDEPGRLIDYHVKEIVFLGDEKYVRNALKVAMRKVKEVINKWEMQAFIQKATDPFVLPKIQKLRKIQLIDASKYEICLNMSEESSLAVASFNFHGTAFTHPFKIGIEGCVMPVTGCVGFGIERWVIAFLAQFGSNEKKWPKCIRDEYYKSIGQISDD